MSVEVARKPVYPNGFEPESSSGDTEEFIKSVKDGLRLGLYDTTDKQVAPANSEDEQPSLPSEDEVDIDELGHGNSLTELVELPTSDDEHSEWLSPKPDCLARVIQTSPGVEDLVISYHNDNSINEEDNNIFVDVEQRSPAGTSREHEKDLLSQVLDEIPDYPSDLAPTIMTSAADIANMTVRQKMQQELLNTRESILLIQQHHQQEIAELKKALDAIKTEQKNERSHLQQKIDTLQKELATAKRKTKSVSRDHMSSLERARGVEQAAQRVELDSVQNKMMQNHEKDVNKLKKAHRAEMIELQQLLKEKEQEVKLTHQQLQEQREMLAAVKLKLEECHRDNQIKQSKLKNELSAKSEQYHRQVKKDKSLAVAKAVEEANLLKNKELLELQQRCQEDKVAALNKMEKKFTTQLEEVQRREQGTKKEHGGQLTTPTHEGSMASKHVHIAKVLQDHSTEKVKWVQKVHQLEQELQQAKNEMRLAQQREKEVNHQQSKENKAIAMEIMEECHKISTLLMKRIRSGKNPVTNCWAAIVQLKNTNVDLSNVINELRVKVGQEKQAAIKVKRERLSEIRKLQSSTQHRRKSCEEQHLVKEVTTLKDRLFLLNKEHLLLEGELNKLRK